MDIVLLEYKQGKRVMVARIVNGGEVWIAFTQLTKQLTPGIARQSLKDSTKRFGRPCMHCLWV